MGGGVYTDLGNVTLTDSTVSGNSTSGNEAHGGGISADRGGVTLNNSTVSENSTSGAGAYGGGIYTNVDLTLTSSTISGNNTIGDDAGGGGIFTRYADVVLASSTISGNSTSGDGAHGGGILLIFGDVTLTDSAVSGNSTSGEDAAGGGIFALAGDVTLTSSTVNGNSTYGELAHGGGIFTGWITIDLVGNSIRSDAGTVTLVNATISSNSVNGSDSNGGGLFAAGSVINILNSTVVENSATGTGGGIGLIPSFVEVILPDDTVVDRTVTLRNSIIASNTDGGTAPDFIAPNDPIANLDAQYSLIGDSQGNNTPTGNGNLLNVDPLLGPLTDNGGPTLTHALMASSPAINAGNNALVPSGVLYDQRGLPFLRDDGLGVDMGAVELQISGDSVEISTDHIFSGKTEIEGATFDPNNDNFFRWYGDTDGDGDLDLDDLR